MHSTYILDSPWYKAAEKAGGNTERSLDLAEHLGRELAAPGTGGTVERLWALAGIAAADVTVARIVEPHLDALAILGEAGLHDQISRPGTWGVFAAEGKDEAGRPALLRAERTSDGWRLSGTKPWCSLAGNLDHALLTAHVEGGRRMFAVDLDDAVEVVPGTWHARGMPDVPSGPIRLNGTAARPVGETDWYHTRAGFLWGAVAVAACWWGGAIGIAAALLNAVRDGRDDPFSRAHLGALDVLLTGCRRSLSEAATLIDSGSLDLRAAEQVRAQVAEAVEETIRRTGHALGPAPLALDARHAARVSDLALYVRQHHAERDLARLGRTVATAEVAW